MIPPNDPELPDEIRKRAGSRPRARGRRRYQASRAWDQSSARSVTPQSKPARNPASRRSGRPARKPTPASTTTTGSPATASSGGSPPALPGPLTKNVSKQDDSRSTVFVRLTTRYVDMGAARSRKSALIDDKPFS